MLYYNMAASSCINYDCFLSKHCFTEILTFGISVFSIQHLLSLKLLVYMRRLRKWFKWTPNWAMTWGGMILHFLIWWRILKKESPPKHNRTRYQQSWELWQKTSDRVWKRIWNFWPLQGYFLNIWSKGNKIGEEKK